MGPSAPRSTVLSAGEETLIVAFRRHTLLPLEHLETTARAEARVYVDIRKQERPPRIERPYLEPHL
jgi:hypothetical protein